MTSPFANLPDISFTDTDPAKVRSDVIAGYEGVAKCTLYPGDPVRLYLEGLGYLIGVQNLVIDAAGKKNLLFYADDKHLDHLGVQQDTPRLDMSPATTSLRFSLAAPLDWKVEILGGTRVGTADKTAVFMTDAYAAIEPGKSWVDVPATATVSGAVPNGLVAGQVNTPIDPVAYIVDVRNTTITASCANREDDDSYRLRIQMAREAYSCAGPKGAYKYHARRVHPDIADVEVWSPKPGFVDVRPVMKGGELPIPEIIQAIARVLSAEDVRPLTDTVTVAAPVLVEYAIKGGWYLLKKNAALAGSIGAAVSTAVEEYRLWQRSMPGRDINPDDLESLVKRAGAKRIQLDTPAFQELHPWQLARETAIDFTFLGVEDE